MQVTRFPERALGPAERVSDFIAHLRMNGYRTGPAETADAIEALARVDATDSDTARLALKTLLVSGEDAWNGFDDLFDAYCCLLYTSPSPRDQRGSRMPSSA